MTYHSQNNEAEIISNYFGGYVGNLLSIGECDGVTFSNSYDLITKGWNAVLLEPNKAMFDLIPEREGVSKFNFGIGATGMQKFYISSDGLLSSTSPDNASRFGMDSKPVDVQFYSYADACKLFPFTNFDFITIDAEGMDWDILQQIDLTHTRCLCIEYGAYYQAIREYCKGFRGLHRNNENLILVK